MKDIKKVIEINKKDVEDLREINQMIYDMGEKLKSVITNLEVIEED